MIFFSSYSYNFSDSPGPESIEVLEREKKLTRLVKFGMATWSVARHTARDSNRSAPGKTRVPECQAGILNITSYILGLQLMV